MPLPMYQENSRKSKIKILAIAAGKGGVGKSTLTVNLAEALSRIGYNVGVLDCDIYGPSVRRMLPEEQPPAKRGEIFLPAVCRMGIRMLSMAYFRSEKEAVVVRAPIANGIITQFLKGVEWGDIDFLLLDFPPGTGDIQLTLAQHANLFGALMVTTPQEVALMDVRKAKALFDQVSIPVLGVVENMSYYEVEGRQHYPFGSGGGKLLANEWQVPLLGEIPVDPEISYSGDAGESLFRDRSGAAAQQFIELAKKVVSLSGESVKQQIGIQQLVQKNSKTFTIKWNDGKVVDYELSALQRLCPCAACVDENTGVRKVDPSSIPEGVEALAIDSVGRYALKIHFTSGCSHGIYSFDMLR